MFCALLMLLLLEARWAILLGADSRVGRADLIIPANCSLCVSNYEESSSQIAAGAGDELIREDLEAFI